MFASRLKSLTAATFAVGGAFLALSGTAHAQATFLGPGTAVTPPPTSSPFGGSLLSEVTSNFTSGPGTNAITGRLLSAVFSGGSTQTIGATTFGGSNLDFYYQIFLDSGTAPAGSAQFIQSFSVSSFAGLVTAVAQTGTDIDAGGNGTTNFSAGGVDSINAGRGGGSGSGITFDFNANGTGGIPVGSFSQIMIVRTNAVGSNFNGTSGVTGNAITANASGIAAANLPPVSAPEPGSVALLAMGLVGTAGTAVRRRSRVLAA